MISISLDLNISLCAISISLAMWNLCVADNDWTGSGPLFFYTGNQGPIEGFVDNSGFIFTLAKEFNALVVFAEHVGLLSIYHCLRLWSRHTIL